LELPRLLGSHHLRDLALIDASRLFCWRSSTRSTAWPPRARTTRAGAPSPGQQLAVPLHGAAERLDLPEDVGVERT
jgi:hypothetical protein